MGAMDLTMNLSSSRSLDASCPTCNLPLYSNPIPKPDVDNILKKDRKVYNTMKTCNCCAVSYLKSKKSTDHFVLPCSSYDTCFWNFCDHKNEGEKFQKENTNFEHDVENECLKK